MIHCQTKKDSYFWYKANWSEEPVLYLTQRRNADREKRTTAVTVYSNIGTPKVYLNGQELSGIRNGYTDVHYVFDNVSLADGKNILKAVVSTKGKEYTDEIEWNYSVLKNRRWKMEDQNIFFVGNFEIYDQKPECSFLFSYESISLLDRKSTRLNSSHVNRSRMPSSA